MRRTSLTSFLLVGALSLSIAACKQPVQVSGDTAEKFTGSITDLLKAGRDVTCTFSRTDEAGTMNGTVYIAGAKRMRGDFTMQNPQFGTMTMHVIRDGTMGYTWGVPTETQGTKMELNADGKPIKEPKENGANIDDPMEYQCSSWRADESMFTVPSNVTFTDISAQVQQIQDAMQGVKAKQCDACDQVPAGEGRDQCKKMMGC